MAALEIRKDRTPAVLRKLAKAGSDTRVARRILGVANALDGMNREAAARSAGMDRQTLRDYSLPAHRHRHLRARPRRRPRRARTPESGRTHRRARLEGPLRLH